MNKIMNTKIKDAASAKATSKKINKKSYKKSEF